jgi:hypothetical protein
MKEEKCGRGGEERGWGAARGCSQKGGPIKICTEVEEECEDNNR